MASADTGRLVTPSSEEEKAVLERPQDKQPKELLQSVAWAPKRSILQVVTLSEQHCRFPKSGLQRLSDSAGGLSLRMQLLYHKDKALLRLNIFLIGWRIHTLKK